MTTPRPIYNHGAQRGVSLIVVMVLLLLATIAVLGSTRTGWLNEMIVSSESDQQRTFAAAEALIRDAERDIRGMQLDGTPCQTGAQFEGCRDFGASNPFFPQEDLDLDLLKARISAGSGVNDCLQGICLPPSIDSLQRANWETQAALDTMTAGTGATAIGATYGQYTGATPADAGNPILSAATPQAWYWVEVFRYSDAAGLLPASNVPIPDRRSPYVYRITAYAQGLKPGTRVWLRSIFVPSPQNQNV